MLFLLKQHVVAHNWSRSFRLLWCFDHTNMKKNWMCKPPTAYIYLLLQLQVTVQKLRLRISVMLYWLLFFIVDIWCL